jgi:hypothetical protein
VTISVTTPSTPLIEPDPLLGAPLAHYPSERGRPLLAAAVVIGAAAVLLNFTLAAAPAWWGPALTILIMALLVLGLGWAVLHVWNREIILYERGFSYREGSNTVYFLYDEVRGIRLHAQRRAYFFGLWRRNVYRFTVTTIRGETIVITNLYRRAAELATRLEERITALLRPRLAARLAAGQSVEFPGAVTLTAAGLHHGERELTWERFGGLQIGGRRLALLDSSGAVWLAVPLDAVENITLLLDFLRERQRQGERT